MQSPAGEAVRLRAKARHLDKTGVLGNGSLLRPALGSPAEGAEEPPALPLRLPAPETVTGSCVTSSFIQGVGRQ